MDIRRRSNTLSQLGLVGSEIEVLRSCRTEGIVIELQQCQTGDDNSREAVCLEHGLFFAKMLGSIRDADIHYA